MSEQRKKPTNELASLYSRFLERQSQEWRARCAVACRERARDLDQLNKRGIDSVGDLLSRLSRLSPKLTDASIDVQFWSMYLISQLCSGWTARQHPKSKDFQLALPRLRQMAANDQRLAPGFWWPVSAGAEDAIGCITGEHPEQEAAERWLGNKERGTSNRN